MEEAVNFNLQIWRKKVADKKEARYYIKVSGFPSLKNTYKRTSFLFF